MKGTAIEWTDATWNPSTGCTKISAGCENCYSERLALRLQKMGLPKYRNGFRFTVHPGTVDLPLRWRKPQMIFVNSMSDLFHEEMPDNFLMEVFRVMEQGSWHVYQILTKRPERMLDFVREYGKPIPDHIWMGVTVESPEYRYRINILREVPVKVRFVSFEPLLGSVGELNLESISWVVVGGESGPNHRRMSPTWAREIRDRVNAQGVKFFFKQWGGFRSKSGGRLLDGKIWDEFPMTRLKESDA